MRLTVTTADFWKAVGEYFLLHRVRLGWDRHHVKKLGGPAGQTIEQIESGTPGNTTKLEQLAQVYGFQLTDIFATILSSRGERITPEAQRVLRKFQSTTVEGRAALMALATALPDAPPQTPEASRGPQSVPPGSTNGTAQ